VRQILVHEREAEPTRYLANLQALLTSPDIRFHLKQVVFALLAELPDPTEDEWHILSSLIGDPTDSHTREAWRTLRGSTPWFRLLDSLGIIKRWLAGPDEERVNEAITLLSSVQRQLPDRVAELVEPYVGTSEEWNKRLVYLAQWAELGAGRRFFDLFLSFIDRGILDGVRGPIAVNSDFWSLIYPLPEEHPDWACEVIGHYLNRRLTISRAAGQPNRFSRHTGSIPDSRLHDEIFMKSARGAPLAFLNEVLPFMLGVITSTANQRSDPPWRDAVWQYRLVGRGYSGEDALLAAMFVGTPSEEGAGSFRQVGLQVSG
jgi:hypothetical protein